MGYEETDTENQDRQSKSGLVISEEVIAKIAGAAALSIKGVSGLAVRPQSFRGLLRGGVPVGSVRIRSENGEIVIDIFLKLAMGVRIQDTCEAVQQNVKTEVQNMTGQLVTKINVHLEDIDLEEHAPAAAQ